MRRSDEENMGQGSVEWDRHTGVGCALVWSPGFPTSGCRTFLAQDVSMNRSINRSMRRPFLLLLAALWAVGLAQLSAGESRTILNLDGDWQIAEGGMQAPPTRFAQTVPVPELVDQAQPAFAEVERKAPCARPFGIAAVLRLREIFLTWQLSRSTRRCSACGSF